jgi:hypothetical protein
MFAFSYRERSVLVQRFDDDSLLEVVHEELDLELETD